MSTLGGKVRAAMGESRAFKLGAAPSSRAAASALQPSTPIWLLPSEILRESVEDVECRAL